MPSAVVLSDQGPDAPSLMADLQTVGVTILGEASCLDVVQTAIRLAPDLVICSDRAPGDAFFGGIRALTHTAARPVIVFTSDPDAEKMVLATAAGVNAYVVNGYGTNRLRSLIHLAQARFRHDQLIRTELADLNQRFTERTLVDRAKGILMGARQLREEEAFRALRSAAMATKQRIGQVSQVVIDSALYAESVNRAGQLRMLSQRLVKLYALICVGVRPSETAGLFADAMAHTDANLALLSRTLSRATFGDLLDAVTGPWERLRSVLQQPAQPGRLAAIDALADALLERAEQLTANLEIAAYAAALHAINLSGRQRMLTQRLAKAALLGTLLTGPAAAAARSSLAATMAELAQGIDYLNALPLTNAAIMRQLALVEPVWRDFRLALDDAASLPGRSALAELSETLLGHFDRLTDELERGIQGLVAPGAEHRPNGSIAVPRPA